MNMEAVSSTLSYAGWSQEASKNEEQKSFTVNRVVQEEQTFFPKYSLPHRANRNRKKGKPQKVPCSTLLSIFFTCKCAHQTNNASLKMSYRKNSCNRKLQEKTTYNI